MSMVQKSQLNSAHENLFSEFTRKYNLSKTLKFELKPVGETKQYLQDFIDSDTNRAKEYKELKKIIDEFHKDYIETTLSHKDILNKNSLKDFFNLWGIKNNKENKDLLDKIKEKYNLKLKKSYGNKEVIEAMEKQFRKDIIEHFKTLNPLLESFFKTAKEEQLLGFLKKFDKTLHKKFLEKKDKTVLSEYLQKPMKAKSIDKSILFSKEFIQYLLPVWIENSHLTEKEKKTKNH